MYRLPDLAVTDAFPALRPLMDARGVEPGGPLGGLPPGAELDALREAVPQFRADVQASGMPDGVATGDLLTLPYPTRFALWRAGTSPSPYLWITNRMLVVQWTEEGGGGNGRLRTLLWEPTDHERAAYTPYFASLADGRPLPIARDNLASKLGAVLPRQLLVEVHGTVLGQLEALGIDPSDVDYLAFDHLHTQDVRRLVGTRGPAPDLGATDGPVEPWFPNARLVTQAREWEAIRHLHPVQTPWYQPRTYEDLPPERLLLVDGDVLLGPGVALMATPGHTLGNMSLVLHTERGIWTSSENGVAAECWTPRASGLAGLRRWCSEWGQDVVMNANTLELAAWQYNSMVAESLVADRTPEGTFRQCFPSSELTAHRLSPGTSPTYTHGAIEHGTIRASVLAGT